MIRTVTIRVQTGEETMPGPFDVFGRTGASAFGENLLRCGPFRRLHAGGHLAHNFVHRASVLGADLAIALGCRRFRQRLGEPLSRDRMPDTQFASGRHAGIGVGRRYSQHIDEQPIHRLQPVRCRDGPLGGLDDQPV